VNILKELNKSQVINEIQLALKEKRPFSLVRIGDGENIVLAQQSVWPLDKVYNEIWAKQALKGMKGISLPDFTLRDHMIKAIKHASVVGILPENDKRINAPDYLKRPLTNTIFNYYQINPKTTCNAAVMRDCYLDNKFWDVFKGYRVLVLYKHARQLSIVLRNKYGLSVKMAIPFEHYNQLKSTMKMIEENQHRFDVVLLSCGVSSVVMAYEIMKRTGKVAIDFGKPANKLLNDYSDPNEVSKWLP